MAKFWFFNAILVLSVTQVALAEGALSRVQHGATTRDVQALLGEPVDRIEREVKREQLWIYPSGSIVFVGGKAASVYSGVAAEDILTARTHGTNLAAKAVSREVQASPVENIISEILREVPSEGGEGASPAPALAPGEIRPVDVAR